MSQGKPIPTRFDEPTIALLDALQDRTGLSKSDLIRRAIAYTLRYIQTSGDTTVLYANPDISTVAETPVPYNARSTKVKRKTIS